MNNRSVLSLSLIGMLCLIASCGAFASDLPAPGAPPISVLVSLEKPSITLGEPIVMKYCIVNETHEPVVIEMGEDRLGWLSTSVSGPSGRTLDKRHVFKLPPQGGFRPITNPKVGVSASQCGTVVLSQDYILPSLGEYRVTVTARIPTKVGESDEEQVVSTQHVLLLKVTKPDPKRLNAVISELATIIRAEGDGSRKPAAIESLFAMPQQQVINTWRELALDPKLGLDALYIQDMLFRFATPDTADILASMGSSSALNSVTVGYASSGVGGGGSSRACSIDLNSVTAGHAVTTLMNVYWAGDASLKKYVEGLFRNHGWDTSHLGNPVLVMD